MDAEPTNQPIEQSAIAAKVKTPGLLILISWLILLGGILSTISGLGLILLNPIAGLGSLVGGILAISIASAIRKLRYWALVTFSVLSIFGVIGSISNFATSRNGIELIAGIVQVVIVAYLWSMRKSFS